MTTLRYRWSFLQAVGKRTITLSQCLWRVYLFGFSYAVESEERMPHLEGEFAGSTATSVSQAPSSLNGNGSLPVFEDFLRGEYLQDSVWSVLWPPNAIILYKSPLFVVTRDNDLWSLTLRVCSVDKQIRSREFLFVDILFLVVELLCRHQVRSNDWQVSDSWSSWMRQKQDTRWRRDSWI